MKIFFRAAFFVLLAVNANAASFAMSDSRLYEIHEAIFDALVPFTDAEKNTTITHILAEAKKTSFARVMSFPAIKGAFFVLDHLHLSHKKTFIKMYYRLVAKDKSEARLITKDALRSYRNSIHNLSKNKLCLSIVDLDKIQRLMLFAALINADVNFLRLIGNNLHTLYTQILYDGALGEQISGYANKDPRIASILPSLPAFKTSLRYSKTRQRIEGHLDAIIVGSGAAGAVAAHEMQAKGLKVLVVEAGSMVIPGAMDTTSDMRFMEGGAPRLSEDGSIALLNGGTVGGGTTINLDMSFPPTLDHVSHRFHRWHEEGLLPVDFWTDEQLADAYGWVKKKFAPREVRVDEINENNRILIRGALKLGIPYRLYELNMYEPKDSPHEVYNKKSSFEILLLPAMQAATNPASLLSDCRVTRVIMKHNRAIGIECIYQPKDEGLGVVHDIYDWHIKPNTMLTIYADNVVLAAGNLGTSAVLLNSDIDNKNIGRGFVAHPFISFLGRFPKPVNADVGEPSSVLIDHYMQTDAHPDRPGYLIETGLGRLSLWALLVPGMPSQVRNMFTHIDKIGGFSVLQTDTPSDDNRVELDRHGQIKVHYRLGDEDRKNLIDGVKTSVKLLFAAGATDVSFHSYEAPLFQNGVLMSNTLTPDMNLDKVFKDFTIERNKTSLLGAHMMGGNRIGVSSKTSVVNSDYLVWDTYGLYVIDSSVYPGSVGANPMNTIYTTAKIFCDNFLSDY